MNARDFLPWNFRFTPYRPAGQTPPNDLDLLPEYGPPAHLASKEQYLFGLDLGQASDFSALAVAHVTELPNPGKKGHTWRNYAFRYLARWPLKTDYLKIVEDTRSLLAKVERPTLCVDATGVGRAVVDIFRRARLPAAQMVPITITAGMQSRQAEGATDGMWFVPKKELVGHMAAVMQTRRFQVSPKLAQAPVLVKEMQAFRVKVSLATGNESFECLTAGAAVETENGSRPIEEVRAGQRVLTRAGYRKVLWSGPTKGVDETTTITYNGGSLRGTPDHLIWVIGRGWVEMRSIGIGDQLWATAIPNRKSSYSTASNMYARQVIHTTTTKNPPTLFTGLFGSMQTARFQTDTISTTKTKTLTTTISPTWNAFPMQNTHAGTCVVIRPRRDVARFAAIHSCAAGNEVRATRTRAPGFVPSSVRPGLKARTGNLSASNAGRVLCEQESPETEMYDSVPHRVATVTGISTTIGHHEPVYDLVVKDCHEFFANGILVHNSWRERDHDDLVLAVALAVWYGERCQRRADLW